MSPLMTGIIGLATLFVLMFLGMPIGLTFAFVGFLGIGYIQGLQPALGALGRIPYSTVAISYIWTTIPLFIFMGYLASQTKLAEEFYDGARKWIGHFRGGLASAVIVGNAAFGAVSGDIVSAAITFVSVSLPEMRKYGYSDRLTLGCISAGSLLALLIPPSLGFLIYGAITQVSIGKLFIAGIFPGLLLAGLYIGVIYVTCRLNPELGPPGPKTTWREKITATTGMWALVAVFLMIIGGLFRGLFTPTEAGAAGAFVVLILGLARRKLSWQGFKAALKTTAGAWGMTSFLLIGVMVFNLFLACTGLPQAIVAAITGMSRSPIHFLLLVMGLYFVLGCFLDGMAIVLLTVPILFPVVKALGIDPLTFGVVAVMCMDIGAVTPPYGIVVFAVSGVVKDVPMYTIFRGAVPFVVAMIVCELLVIFFPSIATFLPGMMIK